MPESRNLGGVNRRASQVEPTPLRHPLDELGRMSDVGGEMGNVWRPFGRSMVRTEHDSDRPPVAGVDRWPVTLVQALQDQRCRFGKEPIESFQPPHFSPSAATTFQSRVVATTPLRSIRALVSFASCDGCASHR